MMEARRTLHVTGFNSKYTSKRLLEELFTQGGPIAGITKLDTHAYILFQHEESVSYCLALFDEVELHGQKLKLSLRYRTKNIFCYMDYLKAVRKRLMAEYRKLPPPNLPPRKLAKIDHKFSRTNECSIKKSSKKRPKNKGKIKKRR